MALSATCGKTQLSYSESCSYTCSCGAGKEPKCAWMVSCPDGKGGFNTTSGTGHGGQPHRHPVLTVAGNLEACAFSLSRLWKRKVTVPKQLRGKRIRKRTLKGTPEEIAKSLGLELRS
jgi:hypothetical protein